HRSGPGVLRGRVYDKRSRGRYSGPVGEPGTATWRHPDEHLPVEWFRSTHASAPSTGHLLLLLHSTARSASASFPVASSCDSFALGTIYDRFGPITTIDSKSSFAATRPGSDGKLLFDEFDPISRPGRKDCIIEVEARVVQHRVRTARPFRPEHDIRALFYPEHVSKIFSTHDRLL